MNRRLAVSVLLSVFLLSAGPYSPASADLPQDKDAASVMDSPPTADSLDSKDAVKIPLPDLFADERDGNASGDGGENGEAGPSGPAASRGLAGDAERKLEASLERKLDAKAASMQKDAEMRAQMQRVASWLTAFGMRNYGHFPGVETGDAWGEKRSAMVQLSELTGRNPYGGWGSVDAPNRGLVGLGPGLPMFSTSDGTAVTGSPVWGDEWLAESETEAHGRVRLDMNYSLSPGEVDAWKSDPPADWDAPPGTITAWGNGQGFLCVWGTGADGKPLKDPSGSGVYIIASRVDATTDDQNAPDEK